MQRVCVLACVLMAAPLMAQQRFAWPQGRQVAVSLSFDDARASQVTRGLDLLARHKAKVTFYVNPRSMERQLEGWKRAVREGHEIGNHSLTHPCSGNLAFARNRALEEFTAARFGEDVDEGKRLIESMLGVKATTFAYPCGSKFVGRGVNTQSTVPLVAQRYLAGRGFRDEAANDPTFVDLAQVLGVDSDGMSFEQMKAAVDRARAGNGWLVLAGHEIGETGYQTTLAATLDQFLTYAADPANGIWLDTVEKVARYVQEKSPRK